jgi:UDP-N-acetylmuramoyl-L-alanyl-D-glutamate--2,6-diaminopimelate ligase
MGTFAIIKAKELRREFLFMKLKDLTKHLLNFTYSEGLNPNITLIEMDSRAEQPGSLFVCMKGTNFDGHEFAQQAVENGAVAVLAERELDLVVPVVIVPNTMRALAILADAFYDQPTTKLNLIGVTGTNGKTTVTHLMEKVFQDFDKKTGLIGTIHMKIGQESYEVKNTTPDALFLQKSFAKMREENVETVLMEVSSHALDYGRVWGCDFNIAIFTNLSQDHLDYHNTMEEYKFAKSLLFSQLGNTYKKDAKKLAVFNEDDKATPFFKKCTSAHIMTYGIDNEADFRAKNININSEGTSFIMTTPEGEFEVQLKLMGKFSVYNALAATVGCYASGLPMAFILNSLQHVEGVSGRFEAVNEGQSFPVIVDYAHTPDSLENVLNTIKQFVKGKIYVVVGCGGDRDRSKRPLMAKIAVQYSDFAIFTSDNPRTEDPKQIIEDMEQGVVGEEYVSIVDRKEAINYAIKQATEDDVVLIAGKGHETYQTIGKVNYDFDDRVVASNAIKEYRK